MNLNFWPGASATYRGEMVTEPLCEAVGAALDGGPFGFERVERNVALPQPLSSSTAESESKHETRDRLRAAMSEQHFDSGVWRLELNS